jgi:cysteine desulfurase
VRKLRDKLETDLVQQIPETRVNGHRKMRIPNTTNITFRGLDGGKLLKSIEQYKIYVTAGAACVERKTPSHVLLAMGLAHEDALASIRFGLSRYNADGEIDYVVGSLKRIMSHLRTVIDPLQRAASQ